MAARVAAAPLLLGGDPLVVLRLQFGQRDEGVGELGVGLAELVVEPAAQLLQRIGFGHSSSMARKRSSTMSWPRWRTRPRITS